MDKIKNLIKLFGMHDEYLSWLIASRYEGRKLFVRFISSAINDKEL